MDDDRFEKLIKAIDNLSNLVFTGLLIVILFTGLLIVILLTTLILGS